MTNHDRLFKELLLAFFLEFMELFFPEVRAYIDPTSIVFLDKEIFSDITSGDRHEVDLVARIRVAGRDTFFLVHVENQAQHQPNFAERMFNYFAMLSQKYGPVYPIALFTFLTPTEAQPDSYVIEFPDRIILSFNFRTIQLNRLNWREFARRDNPVASALMARMNIAPADRPKVKLECIRLLSTFKLTPAKMHLIMGMIDTYLRLEKYEEREFEAELATLSAPEKEMVMETTKSWREAALEEGLQIGIAKGKEEGLAQGKQEGMLAIVYQVLEQRLGSLDAQIRAQIASLDSERLRMLTGALPQFTDANDLVRWIQTLHS